ncbi:MAG: hypothetical protein M3Z37_04590 [Candidatus Eremiobacteraeota bacterium]|nr:hypothetical protein [Candidatus Eremiobacteraeota bacterium]
MRAFSIDARCRFERAARFARLFPGELWRDIKLAARKRGAQRGINAFERQWMSQNGEDGIVREIFNRIGTTNKYFVEFGVEDGRQCNASLLATYSHWHGLFIEGSDKHFPRLARTFSPYPGIMTVKEYLTKENIAEVFARAGVPLTFDFLSIDVDGNDYWLWQALHEYKPRLVVIEYNAAYPPPAKWVMKYNPGFRWKGTAYYGASLTSLTRLATSMGYALIGTEQHGINAFYLRSELLADARLPELTPEEAYHPPRFSFLHPTHPWGYGPADEI